MSIHKAATATGAAALVLSINNIEVVYDHIILVLKGVSLDVPRDGIVALLDAMVLARRRRLSKNNAGVEALHSHTWKRESD